MLETVSNLYGTTTNPHNTGLTPGGSSGGEGALIAMRGSLLGIGTDIGHNLRSLKIGVPLLTMCDLGGSIRVPSAFSGIFGIKPWWRDCHMVVSLVSTEAWRIS